MSTQAINASLGFAARGGVVSTPIGRPPALEIRFTVPGPPVPKARARVVDGHAFTPRRTAAYERLVAIIASAALGARPWLPDALYGVEVVVSRSASRGDWDNYAKSVCDACNGILWVDDRQIRDGRVLLRRVAKGHERVDVRVWTMPEAT